jgi:hypothetical protein
VAQLRECFRGNFHRGAWAARGRAEFNATLRYMQTIGTRARERLDNGVPSDSKTLNVARRVFLFGAGAAVLVRGGAEAPPIRVSDLCRFVR